MHLSIPSPFDLDNPGDFFRAFIRMNSKADGFTHRSFADAIGWPVSYLSDVAQSRKSLTPARAIEFARFVGLDPLAAERLIFMGLHDVLPDSLRSSMEPALSSRHAQQYEGDATTLRYSRHFRAFAVFETIKWLGRVIDDGREVSQSLTTLDVTPNEVLEIVKDFVQEGVMTIDQDGRAIIQQPTFFADEPGAEAVHAETACSLARYVTRPNRPHSLNVAWLPLRRSSFEEYRRKILGLRNWFLEESARVGRQSTESTASTEGDVFLYQLDLNLFPTTIQTEREGP